MSKPRFDKKAIIDKLREDIAKAASAMEHAARESREAATHEEAKPENDKDTRAVEAAYLAGAQAERARDLARTAASLESLPLRHFSPGDAISASAIIELDQDGVSAWYFLAPQGGGMRVDSEGVSLTVLTPQSALGRELLGRAEGDSFDLALQGKQRSYEILTVV